MKHLITTNESAVYPDPLVEHICRSTGLSPSRAQRLLADVNAAMQETIDDFAARRHSELKREGMKNQQIFKQISAEISARTFAAPQLSERQIRRMIYG